jgi:hypothetical protein
MVTKDVTVVDVGMAEGADGDADTDVDSDPAVDSNPAVDFDPAVDSDPAVESDLAVVAAAVVVGPSLLVRYSCTSLGKDANQLGFFPSRNSDHNIADTCGRFVAAICLKDEGIAVKRTSAKDSLHCG